MTGINIDHISYYLPLQTMLIVCFAVHVQPFLQNSTHRQLAYAHVEIDVVDAADAPCNGDIACRQAQAEMATNSVRWCHDTLPAAMRRLLLLAMSGRPADQSGVYPLRALSVRRHPGVQTSSE